MPTLHQLKRAYYAGSVRTPIKREFSSKVNGTTGFMPNDARYKRAVELEAQGWSHVQIGRELGITGRGVWNLLHIPRKKREK